MTAVQVMRLPDVIQAETGRRIELNAMPELADKASCSER